MIQLSEKFSSFWMKINFLHFNHFWTTKKHNDLTSGLGCIRTLMKEIQAGRIIAMPTYTCTSRCFSWIFFSHRVRSAMYIVHLRLLLRLSICVWGCLRSSASKPSTVPSPLGSLFFPCWVNIAHPTLKWTTSWTTKIIQKIKVNIFFCCPWFIRFFSKSILVFSNLFHWISLPSIGQTHTHNSLSPSPN